MQATTFRIWTQVVESTSLDVNHYIMSTSITEKLANKNFKIAKKSNISIHFPEFLSSEKGLRYYGHNYLR